MHQSFDQSHHLGDIHKAAEELAGEGVWLPAMAIAGLVVVGSGYTRPAMNPANAFGWAYMNNWHNMGEQFEYWISQFASAVLEGWAFKLLLKPRI